jgi:hypothetical protein
MRSTNRALFYLEEGIYFIIKKSSLQAMFAAFNQKAF